MDILKPDNLNALISRAINVRLGNIDTLPVVAQSKIRETYTAFYTAYTRILGLKQRPENLEGLYRGEFDPEIIEYMQHFFSDYQNIYRQFTALNQHARALLQTDPDKSPTRFQELLQVLVSGTDNFSNGSILDEILTPPHRAKD